MGIINDVRYMFYVLFHPFDGFFEVRFRNKGNYALSAIIVLLYGIIGIFDYQYRGFIINNNPPFYMNSIFIFTVAVFPILLFIISNWSITTLFNGNGKIKDIFIVIAYSLVPKLVFDFIRTLLSNVIILDEVFILNSIVNIGTIWFFFLLFCGLCVTHEYTVFTNIVTLIATFVAAVIIIFLVMLYFILMGKIVGFAAAVFSEVFQRGIGG